MAGTTRRRRAATTETVVADTAALQSAAIDTQELEAILEAQESLQPKSSIPLTDDTLTDEGTIEDETQALLEAQAEMPAPVKPAVRHPLGTMDAGDLVAEPTILAPRSNASSTTSGKQVRIKGPKNPGDRPIAVVSKDGMVLPFSGDDRDRIALLGYDVTYIYDKDDAKKVIAHNEKMLRDGNVDRVIHGLPMEEKALPTRDEAAELRENLAVAFSPDMVKG